MCMEEKKNELVYRERGDLVANTGIEKYTQVADDATCKKLIRAAIGSLKHSYAPYSGFKVGAALLSANLNIYTGCNIENAAYTPSNCAERTAFFKGVSEGEKSFLAIAIVGGREGKLEDYCPPCGVCRQVMMEFGDPKTFLIILAKAEDDYRLYTLEELLPLGFGKGNL